MKSSTKWLAGFGSAIVALVILAVVLVLVMPGDDTKLPPENTPEGVVMRFIQAVGNREFDTADTYRTEEADETYPLIKMVYPSSGRTGVAWKATVTDSEETGSTARVTVEISMFQPQSAFSDPVDTYSDTFSLEMIDGTWKITEMTSSLWYLW